MDDYFGCSSLMVTCTVDDLCTFRVSIFAGAGETQTLPPLIDFEFRQRQRLRYPGVCSLVYQHLMKITLECLLGWDSKMQTGKPGVLGTLEAYAMATEEQGRKTLHWHLAHAGMDKEFQTASKEHLSSWH